MNAAERKIPLVERLENLAPLFVLLAMASSVLLTFARCFWGSWDTIGTSSLALVVVLIIVFCNTVDDLKLQGKLGIILAMFTISTCSLFWVLQTKDGVWVNTTTKETTLSHGLVAVFPFQSAVYFVGLKQDQTTKVKATTSDGIPLTCAANARGIVLNKESESLEKALTSDEARNPEAKIAGTLGNEIRAAAATVIAAKTSQEIDQLRQFYIPYHVGSRLGNNLSSLGLRWNEGTIQLSCEVIFNS